MFVVPKNHNEKDQKNPAKNLALCKILSLLPGKTKPNAAAFWTYCGPFFEQQLREYNRNAARCLKTAFVNHLNPSATFQASSDPEDARGAPRPHVDGPELNEWVAVNKDIMAHNPR